MKKTNIIRTLTTGLLAALTLWGSGCASIVHGGARSLTVNSQPAGAKVTVTKVDSTEVVHAGITPMTVSLSPRRGYFKGQSYDLQFELRGYRPARVTVRSEVSGWYFGNIIFGGLIGMLIVDPATGAMWNLSPAKIEQSLTSMEATTLKSGDGFIVVLLADTTEEQRANMVLIN